MGEENTTLHLLVLLTPGKRVDKGCSRKIKDIFPPYEKSKHRLSKIKKILKNKIEKTKTKQNKEKKRKEKD